MFLNNYIIIFFNIVLAFIYIRFLFLKGNRIITILKKKTYSIYIIAFIGIVISIIMGYINNTFPSTNAATDFLRITNYLALFCLPIILGATESLNKPFAVKIFGYISFLFVFLVAISLFTRGGGKSFFYGNLFGATTINLSVTSLLVVAGIQYYYRFAQKLGLYIAFVGYLVTVASLAKWNAVVIIFAPYFFYKVLMEKTKSNIFRRLSVFAGSVVLVIFIFFAKDQILKSFASINQFDDIGSYLNSRVLRTKTEESNIESGVLLINGDVGIKDGARFMIWIDLIGRTLETPFTGIGLGARAGSNQDVEDHSAFVFFLSTFGIPLFIWFFSKIYKLYKYYYKIVKNPNFKLSKSLLTLLLANFYFQASVGNVWGQILYVLMLGLIIHFFYFQPQMASIRRAVLKRQNAV
jgi:hypothetical protein